MASLFKGARHAELYLKYRPVYPPTLYKTILGYLSSDGRRPGSGRYGLAVDVGCGSAQSTLPLCDHFENVIGVDTSEAQIDEARKASTSYTNVTYRLSLGHQLSFISDSSVDLVTVAQALHWFDTKKFYQECHRILVSGGVLAVYGYGTPRITTQADAQSILSHFYSGTMGGYWEAGRAHIDDCYAALYKDFSGAFKHSNRDDTLAIEKNYSVDDLLGYLSTWSAYQSYRKKNPDSPDPLKNVAQQLQALFGENATDHLMRVISPVFLLVGTKT